ncbi:glycosyltransferase family 2 protein [Cedecea colo]|uniref:Glycosyltransferase n=1 Tax=Cedecea colo TaxID=2552946 RepID=A0ABX0VS43_9ENTR|nr:glycosyltransferase [Cedecea colo]NIY49742.1 glycosyltransferase [Cedecea colo]
MIKQSGYLLSIIIPSYNNAEFIVDTLSSLQAGITEEVELIIVNDGSTDGTGERIKAFYQDNPDIHVKYIYQTNSGVAITRNVGLENATGKYIGFVDSDDIVSPDYFDILLPVLREEKYDIIEFNLTRDINKLFDKAKANNTPILLNEIFLSDKQLTILAPTFRAAQWHLMTKIFHRNIIGQDRFEEHRRYEDMIFCPFQYFKCTNILNIGHALYFYRINSTSITENLKESDVRHIFFAMSKMCHYIEDNNEKRTIATLMIINCFLEGRKILRKKKGYYLYEKDMLNDIQNALHCCDTSVVDKKIIYKMKYTTIDTFISSVRYRLLKIYRNLLLAKGN